MLLAFLSWFIYPVQNRKFRISWKGKNMFYTEITLEKTELRAVKSSLLQKQYLKC